MDFTKATAIANAWVDITTDGTACLIREDTIAKPYGWVFFYRSKDPLMKLAGNAPILVDRVTAELRVFGTAKPLEHYLNDYEKTLPKSRLEMSPQTPVWNQDVK